MYKRYLTYAYLNDILHLKIKHKIVPSFKKSPLKPPKKTKQNKNNNEQIQQQQNIQTDGLKLVFNFQGSIIPRPV